MTPQTKDAFELRFLNGNPRPSYLLLAAIGAAMVAAILIRSSRPAKAMADRDATHSAGVNPDTDGNDHKQLAGHNRGWIRWRRPRLDAVAISTFLLAIITAVNVYVFVQSERAFVFPIEADFTVPLIPHNKFDMYVIFSNSGKSPATIKELKAAITHDLPTRPVYGQQGITIAFPPIVGGEKRRQSLYFRQEWIESTDNAVKTGSMRFYLYGVLIYTDDFWGTRESQFCFFYIPTDNNGAHRFEACPNPEYTFTK